MTPTISYAGLAAAACTLLATSCGRAPVPGSPQPDPGAHGLAFTVRLAGTSSGNRPSRADSVSSQFLDGVLRVDFPSTSGPSGTHRPAPRVHLLVNTRTKTTTVV